MVALVHIAQVHVRFPSIRERQLLAIIFPIRLHMDTMLSALMGFSGQQVWFVKEYYKLISITAILAAQRILPTSLCDFVIQDFDFD